MAAPPANQSHERAFGVTNIKSHIPLILDLDDHNYDAWRELFLTHCLTFDVIGHLDGTLLPTNAADAAWYKRDGLVKLWIYGTLAPPLFRSSFQTGGTTRDVWTRVENQFRNNKEARAIQLDNELRTQEIGGRTIQEYCQKIKSLADLLTNVDAPVNERTLVMYLLNGLNERFDNIINVIKHKEPFPTFAVAKSMLEMEESRLKKSPRVTPTHTDHSSSSIALTVSEASPTQHQSQQSNQHQRFQNNRGNYRNRGGRNNSRFRGGRYNGQSRPNASSWPSPSFWQGPFPTWPNYFGNWPTYNPAQFRPPPSQFPSQQTQQAHLLELIAGAHATEALPDPNNANWVMDSGATAHLTNSEGNLHSKFNHKVSQSVIVGNGSKIPISCVGSSSINSQSKPLSLNNVLVAPALVKNLTSVRKFTSDNWCTVEFDPFGFSVKDLLTRKILLRCNSSGDLYSFPPSFFNKALSTPTALLASTPSLWHKRLAHTNNSILNSLCSDSRFCNKAKLPSSCEPCQLGKQIKLPFFASQSLVTKPFDIVHSDIWTSPVPSISGIKYYVLFLDDFTHYL